MLLSPDSHIMLIAGLVILLAVVQTDIFMREKSGTEQRELAKVHSV